MLTSAYGIPVVIIYSLSRDRVRNCYLFWLGFGPGLGFGFQFAPLSVWPHLFRGAGHEKRRGEQLKWSLVSLYIGSFPCARLPGPVHTARLGRVCFLCI